MKTTRKTYKYIEWLSPEEMHDDTISWISGLKFARDEQLFLNKLVKSYTIQLLDSKLFEESKELIGKLSSAEKEVVTLMKKVQRHENLLEIMVDEVDQPKMEKAYKETHRELTSAMSQYATDYRMLKDKLFNLISRVMKKEKQKRLLN